MAYTITNLINKYNAGSAQMISNTILKSNGLIMYGTYYEANKQLAHTYNVYTALPTAGVASLGDGVAASNVTASNTTLSLTPFNANYAWSQNYVGTDVSGFMSRQLPLYLSAVGQAQEKAYIYGTSSQGISAYSGTGLHQYCTANNTRVNLSTATGSIHSTIFAIRFSPMEDMDGAAIVVDPLSAGAGVWYTNDYWQDLIRVNGSTGPFSGYELQVSNNSAMILPGTNNVACISGINGSTVPTVTQIDDMLNAVKFDSNTIILVNRKTWAIINKIGKADNIQMVPNEFGYSDLLATWNGVPIIVDDNLLSTQVAAGLYS